MAERNDRLRRARERVESPNSSGEPLSRQELAELLNAWVYENTTPRKILATDANYVGQLERGRIRWPQDSDRRAGFRAVLGTSTIDQVQQHRPPASQTRQPIRQVSRQIQHPIRDQLAGLIAGHRVYADLRSVNG